MTMMPRISIQDVIRSGPALTYKRAPLWDFSTGEFLIRPDGQIITAEDQRTLTQIAHALLITERGMYVIYNFDVGSELWKLIGRSPEYVRSRIKSVMTEAIIDPRITIQQITEQVSDANIFVDAFFRDNVADSRRILQLTAGPT